jgi:hypothetical protein
MPDISAFQSFPRLVIQPQIKMLGGAGEKKIVHCAGPVYPDFEQQGAARHCRGEGPVDSCPPLPPRGEQAKLKEEFVYGGCLIDHYGHFVAEFVHRVVPSLKAFPDLRMVYVGAPDSAGQPMKRFAEQVLAYLGLPKEKILVVDRPVRVRTLHVFAQQECLGGPEPDPAYLAELERIQLARFPNIVQSDQPVFVSRAKQHKGLAGEAALDELFAAAGALIYHPEEHSVEHQLETYLSHKRLVFSEGSALHTLQLLGRVPAQVVVLQRRAYQMGRAFSKPRVHSLEYLSLGLVGLAFKTRHGRPADWKGLSFINPDHLRQACLHCFPDWAPDLRDAAMARALVQLGHLEWQSVTSYVESLPPHIQAKQGADLLGQLKVAGRFSDDQLTELSERCLKGIAPEVDEAPLVKPWKKVRRKKKAAPSSDLVSPEP